MQNAGEVGVKIASAAWTPTTYGVWTAVLILVGIAVKQFVPWYKAKRQFDSATEDALWTRIRELEASLRQKDRTIDGLQRMLIQLQVSSGVVLDLQENPDKAEKAAARLKEMRREQEDGTDD